MSKELSLVIILLCIYASTSVSSALGAIPSLGFHMAASVNNGNATSTTTPTLALTHIPNPTVIPTVVPTPSPTPIVNYVSQEKRFDDTDVPIFALVIFMPFILVIIGMYIIDFVNKN
jgi:hypothetical protein